MLDNFLRLSALFDCYGSLLTGKQQKCLKMHLYQDWSLSEIAACLHISRQAAYDMLHRCEITLEKYDANLNLLQKDKTRQKALLDIAADINSLRNGFQVNRLNSIENKIKTLLNA